MLFVVILKTFFKNLSQRLNILERKFPKTFFPFLLLKLSKTNKKYKEKKEQQNSLYSHEPDKNICSLLSIKKNYNADNIWREKMYLNKWIYKYIINKGISYGNGDSQEAIEEFSSQQRNSWNMD